MSNELRAKKAFLAHMRHELRTPINGIIGYSELLIEDAEDGGWDDLVVNLGNIRAAGRELLSLVNSLLEAAKIDAQADIDVNEMGRTMQHALRTPITTVTGYGELLIEEAEDHNWSPMIPDLRRITASAGRLTEVLGEIIEFSQTQGGTNGPDVSAVSAMVRDAVDAIQALDTDRSHSPSTETGSILVVDDNETNRDLLTRHLERRGHTVAAAADGVQALEMIKARDFDLVLLDVLMPEMNGYEVLRQLKSDDELQHLPVIMISAMAEMDSVVRCIEAGAEDYLPKPFDPVLLHARIRAGLARKRLHDLEQAYVQRLQAEWENAKRLADNLRHVVRSSLQNPPEEMLAESLEILMKLTGAAMGAILEDDDIGLRVLCANPPDAVGARIPWESVAGETMAQKSIIYGSNATELTRHMPAAAGNTADCEYLLSVPIPCIISARRKQAPTRCAGVLLLTFRTNAFPSADLTAGTTRFGLDLAEEFDSQDRLLRELFMILPMISLGMEIQKLRQTSYQVIHELKNKLISAQSWTECLKEDLEEVAPKALDDEQIQEDLQLTAEAVDTGFKLAVNYLQFTKIYSPQFRDCSMNDVLRATATDLQALADKSNGSAVSVVQALDESIPVRQLDPDQLKMAFFNLGKNAVEALLEHGVEAPRITLSSMQSDGQIAVQIADNGKGMPPEVAANLFVAFTTKKSGGTGLGLTIAKKIVEIHGGTICCETGPNGTTFSIGL